MTDNKFHCLVADTTAFIENVSLQVNTKSICFIKKTLHWI